MVGVRRSSCRPSPPRIMVLPVSIMTTLESRKPMLLMLIVFESVGVVECTRLTAEIRAPGLGLGFWVGTLVCASFYRTEAHKHQQQMNRIDAWRGVETFGVIQWCVPSSFTGIHNGMEVTTSLIRHTRQEILFSFWQSKCSSIHARRDILSSIA